MYSAFPNIAKYISSVRGAFTGSSGVTGGPSQAFRFMEFLTDCNSRPCRLHQAELKDTETLNLTAESLQQQHTGRVNVYLI